MENKIIETIRGKKVIGCKSLYAYAALVADLEFLSSQNPTLFSNNSLKEKYLRLWNEMEILNACALDEWESKGKPKNFSDVWDDKYKCDATDMLCKLIDFLEGLEK